MFENALRYLTQIGLRRGMSGSRVWMTAAIVAVTFRTLRRLARTEPEILYRTQIRPGDRFRITARPPA